MSTSIFEQVTSSLTVMSICGSLGPDIYEGTPLSELESLLAPGEDPNFDPFIDPCPVRNSNGDLVGILDFSDYAELDPLDPLDDPFVEDVMHLPAPRQLLSSSTTVLEAVEIFPGTSNQSFYIIHGNQVVGYLLYRHLFHPVGLLAFLALALEIEEQALRLCQHPPFREGAWKALSDNRRGKAIEIFRRQYGCEPHPPRKIDRLIDCTQLVDKATIIWKMKLTSPASSRSELLGFFENLRKIRDFCAHPQRSSSDDGLIPKQKLSEFISNAKSMRDRLNDSLLSHKVGKYHQRPFFDGFQD